ncbi:MAG: hypothetical protein EPN93_10390 [Spirochaetes bacterium]|nr:MAG: hypothetical protein EPN93_10390 [Spirochaetota bacterium]
MRRAIIAIVCAGVMLYGTACSKKANEAVTVSIQSAVGDVKIVSEKGDRAAKTGEAVAQGDTIKTGVESLVDLTYGVSGVIRINESSLVKLATLFGGAGGDSRIEISEGRMFVTVSKLQKGDKFEVASPTTIAAVRGTSFKVTADSETSRIDVISGTIKVNPVQDGKVIAEIESVVEVNKTVTVEKKDIKKMVEEKKTIEVKALKVEEVRKIREEVKDIKPAERLNESVRKEFQEVVIAPRDDKDKEADKKKEEERRKKEEERRLKDEADLRARGMAERAAADRLASEKAEREKAERDAAEAARLEKERIEKQQQETKEKRVKNIPTL